MLPEDRGPWALFLGGHYRKTAPTKDGLYPVATREGVPVDPSRWLRISAGKQVNVPVNEPGWRGYWWSLPVPQMPRNAPEWE